MPKSGSDVKMPADGGRVNITSVKGNVVLARNDTVKHWRYYADTKDGGRESWTVSYRSKSKTAEGTFQVARLPTGYVHFGGMGRM